MIKVVNIITDSNIGGAGVVLINFMHRTDTSKFKHLVVVPRGSMLTERLRSPEITVIELDGIAERSFSPKALGAFRKIFADFKPDVVHTHASLAARLAARLYGKCKIIYTRHCAYELPRSATRFPKKQITGAVCNALSDLIIAISPSASENLVDMGVNPKKIFVMFNGVDPVREFSDEERAAARRALGVSETDFVCAIIARLELVKGHDYVLEAAKLLSERPIKLLIAGTGTREEALKAEATRLGLTNTIFTGFVSDVERIENIMDLQLNASFGTETSSLSLLEGMSLGIPAVVSDFGGNPYLIANGENGLVVPKKDAAALADAIASLMDDPDRMRRMSARSREIYKERFTLETMVNNIENAYRRVLDEK
ncbi:MAG: glycosyltransferase [Oscillospiraceae bacterium]|jgi:glycosyltransferase involved in cell wall biosynthesis|nr:glycosyltransferase [Oscillospiraceae bacterium]